MDFKEVPPAFLGSPVAFPVVLSGFGKRSRTFHTGIDVRTKGAQKAKVFASGDGRVIFAGKMRGYGRTVLVRHKGGYKTRYAHLKNIKVKTGARLGKGDLVGWMGKTGRASAIHLHFEVIHPSGKFIDPRPIFY